MPSLIKGLHQIKYCCYNMSLKSPDFSSILNRFKQKNNIASLLNKGKEGKIAKSTLDKTNHYEMDSEEIKQAEFLFNNPIAHSIEEPKPLQKSRQIQEQPLRVKSILKESSIMVQEPNNKKDKSVSFLQQGKPIMIITVEKKWNDAIQGQKKGKFDPSQHEALCSAVGEFLISNQLQMDEFKQMITEKDKQKTILKKEKFFKFLSTVLPNRSPMSCYKYILRNFNDFNHQGPWTKQEVEQLLALVDKYGRKWKLIARQMKRTSDNVYDKYRALGQQGLQDRSKGVWKLKQLVILLTQLQNQSKVEFLNPKIKQTLAEEQQHDKQEQAQFAKHKYNTKKFIFHNIQVVKNYIHIKELKSIDLQTLRWKKIMKHLPTRSIFDCRNKVVQILQILFRNNNDLDEILVSYLEAQRVNEQAKINWKTWNHEEFTPEEARNRFMILKKIVEGRSRKTFDVIVKELRAKMHRQNQKPALQESKTK